MLRSDAFDRIAIEFDTQNYFRKGEANMQNVKNASLQDRRRLLCNFENPPGGCLARMFLGEWDIRDTRASKAHSAPWSRRGGNFYGTFRAIEY